MNTDDVPSLAVDTMAQKTMGFAMRTYDYSKPG